MAGKEFIQGFPIREMEVRPHERGLSILDIIGDDGKSTMSIHFDDDRVYFQLTNYADLLTVPSPGMLFKKDGKFPYIQEEFSLVKDVLMPLDGQVDEGDFEGSLIERPVSFEALGEVMVMESHDPRKPMLVVANIRNDQEERSETYIIPGDNSNYNNSMDIEVYESGDVRVRITETRQADEQEGQPVKDNVSQVSIVFKEEKNGGKNPTMAQVFRRVANRLAIDKAQADILKRNLVENEAAS